MRPAQASPVHRVKEVLKRLEGSVGDPQSVKTCMGVLAILSRDEANKLLVARDGIRLILGAMEAHMECASLQEAGALAPPGLPLAAAPCTGSAPSSAC